MPKKRFEEMPYNPISADLAREVGMTGRVGEVPGLPELARVPRPVLVAPRPVPLAAVPATPEVFVPAVPSSPPAVAHDGPGRAVTLVPPAATVFPPRASAAAADAPVRHGAGGPSPASAVAPAPIAPVPRTTGVSAAVRPGMTRAAEPTITKRFVLTRSEDAEVNDFLLRLQRRAGAKVTVSVLTRAALWVAMQAEELILTELGAGLPCPFPSTHDGLGQGEFEECWIRCLTNAFRRLPRAAQPPQPNLGERHEPI